jgi:hypothetical protein
MLWILAVLLWLSTGDLLGALLVSPYASSIVVSSPLRTPNAMAETDGHTIWIDRGAIETIPGGPEGAMTVAACSLVHEAAHIRYPGLGHEVAYLWGYVCLERMGAPKWLRDGVYQQALSELQKSTRSREEREWDEGD